MDFLYFETFRSMSSFNIRKVLFFIEMSRIIRNRLCVFLLQDRQRRLDLACNRRLYRQYIQKDCMSMIPDIVFSETFKICDHSLPFGGSDFFDGKKVKGLAGGGILSEIIIILTILDFNIIIKLW